MLTAFQIGKPGAGAPSSELLPVFAPISVARMIWKRKVVAAGIAVLGCALTLWVIRRMPSIYVSEALVLIDSQKIPEKFVPSTVNNDLQDRIATISQEILSTSRLEKIISDFNLYQDERKTLLSEDVLALMRKDISIEMERGLSGTRPGAFRVSYSGKDPKVVARVTNRIANLFIEENTKTREVQAEGTSEFMDSQLAEAKARLDQLEASVSQFKLKHNGELPEQQGELISNMGRLEADLRSNRDALNRLQESKSMLESNLATTEATLQALAAVGDRPEESAAVPVVAGAAAAPPKKPSEVLEAQLEALSGRYGPAHPDVKRLQAEIAAQKAVEAADPGLGQVAQLAEAPAPAPKREAQETQAVDRRAQTSEHLASLKAQIGIAEREIEFRSQEQTRIEGEMKESSDRISRLPLREQEMAQVTRDYEISKTNYRSLLDKKLAAEMSTNLERGQKPERFTLIDPARVPGKPQRPKRPLLYAFGSLLSLTAGLAAGLGMELKQNSLLGEWELGPQIPILARLPKMDPSRV
jgi:polysaccharide biosynthesis transport protein